MYGAQTLDAWWTTMQTKDRREWIRVSAEVGDYLQGLSGRDDLIAVVEPGVAMGNLAVYVPETAAVQVDTDKCAPGVNPADIHMNTEVGRLEQPALTGGCTHEGFHAFASKWALDQRAEMRHIVSAALLLEESRCEKRGLEKNPDSRTFLRAGFRDLVMSAPSDPQTKTDAARLAGLSMARVDAGILDAAEMAPVKEQIIAITGEDLYADLQAIWLEAHTVADDDQAAMEALGKRWIDLLPEDEREDGSKGIEVIVCGGVGVDPGEGEGEGKGSVLSAVADAIAEAAESEAAGEVEGAKVRDAAAERGAESAEVKKSEQAAKAVFKKSDEIGHGHGVGGREGISGIENPSAKVRATANVLARAIQKAQHRERSKTHVASAVPPGRLRSASAVRRSAQRSMGIPVTAEPWKQTVRKHVDNPPITVGIMCDISGSMSWAERPVAEAAWAIAHAVHKNDGDTATVAYGEHVHAVTKPGENPKGMRTFDATGGFENIIDAIRALDGGLNLGNGTGVRMLINVSDGQYRHSQRSGGEALLKRLTARGVKVLWVDMDGRGRGGTNPITMPGVTVVTMRSGDDLGRVIGAAMTKALNAA